MGLMRLTADGMLDPLFDGDGMLRWISAEIAMRVMRSRFNPTGPLSPRAIRLEATVTRRCCGSTAMAVSTVHLEMEVSQSSIWGVIAFSIRLWCGRTTRSRPQGYRQNSEFAFDMILAHFTSNGTLDLTYAVEGVATADFGVGTVAPESLGHALIQQADGKLVAVGVRRSDLAAARFDDGSTFPGIIGLSRTVKLSPRTQQRSPIPCAVPAEAMDRSAWTTRRRPAQQRAAPIFRMRPVP